MSETAACCAPFWSDHYYSSLFTPLTITTTTAAIIILAAASGDPRETSFLWQRISVLIQRFNAILIGETFLHPDEATLNSDFHFTVYGRSAGDEDTDERVNVAAAGGVCDD